MVVIGVHTPEFNFEKERSRVESAVKRHSLTHPIVMDNDYQYWNALGNRAWPSFYLVNQEGEIVLQKYGEMHKNTAVSKQWEQTIESLLEIN